MFFMGPTPACYDYRCMTPAPFLCIAEEQAQSFLDAGQALCIGDTVPPTGYICEDQSMDAVFQTEQNDNHTLQGSALRLGLTGHLLLHFSLISFKQRAQIKNEVQLLSLSLLCHLNSKSYGVSGSSALQTWNNSVRCMRFAGVCFFSRTCK